MVVSNINNLPTTTVSELKATQGDLKDLTKANYEKLKASIEKHGFIYPVAVWIDEHKQKWLLDGHQRIRVLQKEKWGEPIPFIEIPASSIQEAAEILLKITSQYGTITQEGIDAFIATYQLPEYEVYEAVQFDALPLLGTTQKTETKEDEPPEVEETPYSELGKVYQLGNHRVLCGDATGDLSKLLGQQKIDLYITDPPYNVDYEGKTKDKLKIQNDKKDDAEFLSFLQDSFTAIDQHLKDGAAFYIYHADLEGYNFRGAVKSTGWLLKQNLVWVKNSMVMGRQDYQWQHEPILYGWKSGASHAWYSDRKQTTILNFDRPTVSKEHPTMKPIAINAYFMANSSKEGDLIFDSFLGSGSTLIAAEQMNRVCYGIELDPRYVDVIRKRYAKFINNDVIPDNWQELTPELG